jgi:UrcA family protein
MTMTKLLRHGLLLAALTGTPVLAEPMQTSHRSIVRTSDLDLATASGQRLLDRRLAEAVTKACGAASKADLAGHNAVRRCRVGTRARLSTERQRLTALATTPARVVTAAR